MTTSELLSQSPTASLYLTFDITSKMTQGGKVDGLLNGTKLDQRITVIFSYSTCHFVPSAVPLSCRVEEVYTVTYPIYQGPGGGDGTCPHQGCR